ncbi:MAG: deoxyribonuclease IV [Jatrophihabitantaceae bacterium]
MSVAGGLRKALPRADEVGAETMQIFVANPRGWAAPTPDSDGDEQFRAECAAREIAVFVHAPYLINFGSPSSETLAKSSVALEFSLRRAAAIGARGVVLHAGSAVLTNSWDAAMAQVREHVLSLLDDLDLEDAGPRLLIEPTAGGGGALASDATSLGAYLDALGRDPRLGVCLDTCHMHAAGHDLSTMDGFAAALRAFGRAAGRGVIGLVHVNDSRDPVGSKRDRHTSLGAGAIGPAPFAALFTSTVTRNVPLVVETAEADHATDIATLKALRDA